MSRNCRQCCEGWTWSAGAESRRRVWSSSSSRTDSDLPDTQHSQHTPIHLPVVLSSKYWDIPWHFPWLCSIPIHVESVCYCQLLSVAKMFTVLYTHTHTHLMALFLGLSESAGTRNVRPIWILLKQETVSGSGISWAICKSAPRSRQITMPAPHQSVFYRPDALPAAKQQCQSTEGTVF